LTHYPSKEYSFRATDKIKEIRSAQADRESNHQPTANYPVKSSKYSCTRSGLCKISFVKEFNCE